MNNVKASSAAVLNQPCATLFFFVRFLGFSVSQATNPRPNEVFRRYIQHHGFILVKQYPLSTSATKTTIRKRTGAAGISPARDNYYVQREEEFKFSDTRGFSNMATQSLGTLYIALIIGSPCLILCCAYRSAVLPPFIVVRRWRYWLAKTQGTNQKYLMSSFFFRFPETTSSPHTHPQPPRTVQTNNKGEEYDQEHKLVVWQRADEVQNDGDRPDGSAGT